jgi:hypothetical protein
MPGGEEGPLPKKFVGRGSNAVLVTSPLFLFWAHDRSSMTSACYTNGGSTLDADML